ncbi:MAG: MBL fold metallo-hydrolase [Candidatus Methylomirabilales bacterium]
MYFKQFQHPESGCLSYVVGCMSTRELAVVDPAAGVEPYLGLAEEKRSRITHVIDTHIHADHRSGAAALAGLTGAPLCLHQRADVAFGFRPLADREVVQVGNAHVRVIHTPGHSPESVCLLVSDMSRSPEPAFLLTGDTLLVGDVGRPDLHVPAEEGARDLYRSLHERILTLEDHLEIFPAHFSGSVCGVGLSPRTSSTLGYERRVNPLLYQELRLETFVEALAGRKVARPAGYEQNVAANRGVAA